MSPTRLPRRRFLSSLLSAALIGGVGACFPQLPAPTPPPTRPAEQPKPASITMMMPAAARAPTPTTGKVTLQFWTQWAGRTKEVWEGLMSEFGQAHPTIEVVSSHMPLAELQRTTAAAITAGTPPDLWINSAMVRPELIVDGAVASLDSLGKVPDDFYPAADPATVRFGQRWGVPNNGGVPVIWYHEALFRAAGLDPDQPPRTWDDLIAYGKKLTNPQRKQWGLIVPNRRYPWTTECWYGFLLQAGGDLFTPDGAIAFNSEPGVEALQFWTDLFLLHKTSPLQMLDNDTLLSDG